MAEVEFKSVVEDLKNNKAGVIFIDDYDWLYYTLFFIFGSTMYWVIFYAWEHLFNNVFVMSRYIARSKKDKYYLS